jgi:short subunit dehydrogenase-like uncharacterized protein
MAVCRFTQRLFPTSAGTRLGGGFLTPATALGNVLVDRLRAAGIVLEVSGGAGGPGKL